MDMWKPSDKKLNELLHVLFTSDGPLDPTLLDEQLDVADLILSADDKLPEFASEEINNYGGIHSIEHSIHSTTSSLCTEQY
jgi:hypothetical protein